jgi:hypothetical protein
MSYIQVSKIGTAITGSVNGESFGITYTKAKYDAMKALEMEALAATTIDDVKAIIEEFLPLTKENFADKVMTACPYVFVDAAGRFFLQWKGQTLSQQLPGALVDRILKSVEEDLEFLPLIKAWIRFLRNPNYSPAKGKLFANYINKTYTDHAAARKLVEKSGFTEEVANNLATLYQTPITMEGLLCTYKVSKELTNKYILDADGNKKVVSRYVQTIDENTGIVSLSAPEHVEDMVFEPAVQGTDGDAFSCLDMQGAGSEGHIIKVGHRIVLKDWAMVNTKDTQSCVKGLHAGNLDYIKGYQSGSGKVTHNVFIDPAMIGAFTDDGSGAIRVKEYFVHSSMDKVNRNIYHSSEYGKVTDAEYEIMLQDSLVKYGELQAETVVKQDEAQLIGDLND